MSFNIQPPGAQKTKTALLLASFKASAKFELMQSFQLTLSLESRLEQANQAEPKQSSEQKHAQTRVPSLVELNLRFMLFANSKNLVVPKEQPTA